MGLFSRKKNQPEHQASPERNTPASESSATVHEASPQAAASTPASAPASATQVPAGEGLRRIVELMRTKSEGQVTLNLSQQGNDMNFALYQQGQQVESGVVAPGTEWFDAVVALYTEEEKSERGAWARAQVVVDPASDSDSAVQASFMDAETSTTHNLKYGLDMGGAAASGAEPGQQGLASAEAEGQASDAVTETAEADAQGQQGADEEFSGGAQGETAAQAEERMNRISARLAQSETPQAETAESAFETAESQNSEPQNSETQYTGTRYSDAQHSDAQPSGIHRGEYVAQRFARPVDTTATAESDLAAADEGQPHHGGTGEDGAHGVEESPADTPEAVENSEVAEATETYEPAGTGETVETAEGVETVAATEYAPVETTPVDDSATYREGAVTAEPATSYPATAGMSAYGVTNTDLIGGSTEVEDTAVEGTAELPDHLDDSEFEDDPAPAESAPVVESSHSASSLDAPMTGSSVDVSPSYSSQEQTKPSSTRKAPGNLVLTEAEVVSRFAPAYEALFGAEGSARDVSTVLIRVRTLGSYYDALTHVRRNGFWEQVRTFELIPEETLGVLQLKADSYKEGYGSPLAISIRFTPGTPVDTDFSYTDEEAFVRYPEHLPAQQYVEELRMFPRTGEHIPAHMNEALASWNF